MIFHSGNVQGLAKFYRIPSSATSFSGAGGAPLSVLRSLYQTVRRDNSIMPAKSKDPAHSLILSGRSQKPA
jgi:hypothetical protein